MWERGRVRLEIVIELERVPEPKDAEVGRILRYWAGAAKQMDLGVETEQPLMDSGYQPVGTLRITP